MSNFQDTFETRKRSFISAFSVCVTVPLSMNNYVTRMFNETGLTSLNLSIFIVNDFYYCITKC